MCGSRSVLGAESPASKAPCGMELHSLQEARDSITDQDHRSLSLQRLCCVGPISAQGLVIMDPELRTNPECKSSWRQQSKGSPLVLYLMLAHTHIHVCYCCHCCCRFCCCCCCAAAAAAAVGLTWPSSWETLRWLRTLATAWTHLPSGSSWVSDVPWAQCYCWHCFHVCINNRLPTGVHSKLHLRIDTARMNNPIPPPPL
jgi:hypothetical protein